MNLDKKLVEKAKYYEKITRQYNELSDFLQALEFGKSEDSIHGYMIENSRHFDEYNELKISTPAILEHERSSTELIYKVNLIKDLGMEDVNKEVIELLIKRVVERMTELETELEQAFGKEENDGCTNCWR